MNKCFYTGIVSSSILFILTVIFLAIIVLMGHDAPSGWGVVSAAEKSVRSFSLFRLAIVTAFIALPFWSTCFFSIYNLTGRTLLGRMTFFLSASAVICVGIAYTVELFKVIPQISTGMISEEVRNKLLILDNKMFAFDNAGYFLMGISSIMIISVLKQVAGGTFVKTSLLLFGIASMVGLPGFLLDNDFLMMINLIGMTLTYPLAGAVFIIFYLKYRAEFNIKSSPGATEINQEKN